MSPAIGPIPVSPHASPQKYAGHVRGTGDHEPPVLRYYFPGKLIIISVLFNPQERKDVDAAGNCIHKHTYDNHNALHKKE